MIGVKGGRRGLVPAFKLTEKLGRLAIYALLIVLSFLYLYLLLFIVSMSLKGPNDLIDQAVKWIPREMAWSNYATAFRMMNYGHYLKNSLVMVLLSTLGHIVSCSLAGYSFARFKVPFREGLFMLAMLTLIIPPQSIIIPLVIQYKIFGWMDSVLPIIVPTFFGSGLKGGLFIFIFRQVFRTLPPSLEDAARIDGCGNLKTFLYIVLPIAKPAMLVTCVLSIVWHWNEYFEPYVYLVTQDKFTLPMILNTLRNAFDIYTKGLAETGFGWPIIVASIMLVLLPLLIFYVIAQRGFVKSIERVGLVE